MARLAIRLALGASLTLAGLVLLCSCGSGSSMGGSWVPAHSGVRWTVSGGPGWDFSGNVPRHGGLVISKEGGSYKVTLVSVDGSRYPTVTKMDGAKLDVYSSPGAHSLGAPDFYLKLSAAHTLSMYEYEGQWQLTTDFKPGSP